MPALRRRERGRGELPLRVSLFPSPSHPPSYNTRASNFIVFLFPAKAVCLIGACEGWRAGA